LTNAVLAFETDDAKIGNEPVDIELRVREILNH
jgi:hypothetical protein